MSDAPISIRRASPHETGAASAVMIRSRHANVPAIPPLVHTDEEVTEWFDEVVMATQAVWIAEQLGQIVGVLVSEPGWVEQLYVDPDSSGAGIGTALLAQAKTESDGDLQLWTFASNTAARRFYERHGFIETGSTNGDNEEQAPDILLHWTA